MSNTNPLVDFYLVEVNKIAEIDSKIGDSGSSGRATLNALVRENTAYVASAQQLLGSIIQIEDETERLVKMQTLVREATKMFGPHLDQFVAAHTVKTPESEAASEEAKAALAAERSDAQKIAKQLYGALKIALSEEDFAQLPECPEGIRGAVGPRGAMGRKIPGGFSYTVNGEDMPALKTAAEVAKAAQVKTAELRLAVEAAYPDALPNEWTVTVGKSVVDAVRVEAEEEVVENDDPSAETDADFD